MIVFGPTDLHRFLTCSVWDEGVSLFIGLRRINGTLTAFLGLLTDFKRKLDLAVVAIPPIAGKSLPLLCNRKPAYTALAQWPQGQIRLNSVRNP